MKVYLYVALDNKHWLATTIAIIGHTITSTAPTNLSQYMSQPATVKFQQDICSLVHISPHIAALYLSKYRLSNRELSAASIFCTKCGSLTSTRIERLSLGKEHFRCVHNCEACGFTRKLSLPSDRSRVEKLPEITSPNQRLENAKPPLISIAAQKASSSSTFAQRRKKSTLQHLLAKSREQNPTQHNDPGISDFLQQL